MPYRAPIRDMLFTACEVLDGQSIYTSLGQDADLGPDSLRRILREAARFAENELSPLNRPGDVAGCEFHDGAVSTPPGFKRAFDIFREGGWLSLAEQPEYGGQGLPLSVFMMVYEMLAAANVAWSLYVVNYYGSLTTLRAYATEEQKALFVPPLISGEWSATMCLTEPHCGTDLGLIATSARELDDGRFELSGTKIFITGGEHDFTGNILHLVLARIAGAPAGPKGLSLFAVSKYRLDRDGATAERNRVACTGIERKMGMHGSATCTLSFDRAQAFLVGERNGGLEAMFACMNESRVTAAIQAVGIAEMALQGSLCYATERLQMRAVVRAARQRPADPIICQPDVRRLLLVQQALVQGGRMLSFYCSLQMDIALASGSETQRHAAEQRLALLTPIAKGFIGEAGLECTNAALQIFGGHGYISDNGMEQHVRDQRITSIYEGVTAVQAIDLLDRKVLRMRLLPVITAEIRELLPTLQGTPVGTLGEELRAAIDEWQCLTDRIEEASRTDPCRVGASAFDYLMYSGYLLLGYFWARAARVAAETPDSGADRDFYRAKLATARFYFSNVLVRKDAHARAIWSDTANLMAEQNEVFTSLASS
jgi:hypothetical protein